MFFLLSSIVLTISASYLKRTVLPIAGTEYNAVGCGGGAKPKSDDRANQTESKA
jgi:hypothetical protein